MEEAATVDEKEQENCSMGKGQGTLIQDLKLADYDQILLQHP